VSVLGDPKKQRKKYTSPRSAWSSEQLENEIRLLGEYGLRNKKEIWRHRSMLSKYRSLARGLLGKTEDQRKDMENQILKKLYSIGVIQENSTLDDILDLAIEDILERRLQTVVFRRGLAKTISQSRQFINHGHISVGERRITVPSYVVEREDEEVINYAMTSPFDNMDHPLRKDLISTLQNVESDGGKISE
jgi:small subunit ribosomal protein S4